jgi:ornithine cyclodeaminase/alanine dehydrogenase-like protein (mu-crystallin family)
VLAKNKTTILFLSESQIAKILSMRHVIQLVESAFIADGQSQVETFPVISYGINKASAGWVIKSGAISSGLDSQEKVILGLKAGAYWPHNEAVGIPNHNATMMLVDVQTGLVSTILGANAITSMRTAAAGAISSKWLANPNPEHIAIIGAGDQASSQLEAHLFLFPSLSQVTVWNRIGDRAERLVSNWASRKVNIRRCSTVQATVEGADIVVTTTPSRVPLVFSGWIKSGAHICAIGSDAPGKQEIDARLVMECSVFVDKRSQTASIGEMQHVLSQGMTTMSHVRAELSEVCARMHPGRQNNDEITLFDSSGVSFQDLIVADYVRNQASIRDLGDTLAR